MTTRRDILKGGAGLAAILASGKAPAYLVKSMLAARNSIGMKSGGAKVPTAADYVQTGLVAMWDGIENAGWGVHDSNATAWKDLIGNNDLTTTNTCAAEKDGTITGIESRECCCKINPVGSSAQALLFYSGAIDATHIGLVWYAPNVGFQNYGSTFWSYPTVANEEARTIVATTSSCFVNGEELQSVSHSTDNWSNGPHTGIGGRAWQSHNWRGAGDYYSVRIYSRALTAAEIAANYAVDKQRFNLPTAS